MRLSYNGYYTRLPSQGRGFDSHQPLNIKVLRQTEEATLVVASSYNAVVKWISMNSLYLIDTMLFAGSNPALRRMATNRSSILLVLNPVPAFSRELLVDKVGHC